MSEEVIAAIAITGKESIFGLSLFLARKLGVKTPVGVMEIFNELTRGSMRPEVKALITSIVKKENIS